MVPEWLKTEQLISLAELAERIRSNRRDRRGQPIHPQAVWRWHKKGVLAADKQNVVKLTCAVLCGKLVTSWERYLDFVAQQQAPALPVELPAPIRSAGRRSRASARAEQVLVSDGI